MRKCGKFCRLCEAGISPSGSCTATIYLPIPISPPQYTALYGRKMRVLGVAWPSIVLHFPVLPRPSRRAQTGR